MKGNNSVVITLLVGCFLLLGFIAYKIGTPRTLTLDECLRLGSNERSSACIELIKERANPQENFDIANISISDAGMDGNTYYSPNPTYHATLKNNSIQMAKNIVMKFKFFKLNSSQSCDDDSADTKYVTVLPALGPGDTATVKTIVLTDFDTTGRFNWCASVYSASTPQSKLE